VCRPRQEHTARDTKKVRRQVGEEIRKGHHQWYQVLYNNYIEKRGGGRRKEGKKKRKREKENKKKKEKKEK
jgi:hypothetical protein